MGYFKIGKYKIFYSDDRFVEINKPFYENLSAVDMIGLKILDFDGKPNKNYVKLASLQVEKLKEDYKNLKRNEFIKKWVEFEFTNEQAKNVGWEIICDYFEIHKNGHIKDLRDFNDQLVDEYDGNNYIFPQGEVIGLEFNLIHNRNIITKFFDSSKTLRFVLNLAKIERIKGDLTDIEISTDSQFIKLGKKILIINKNVG